MPFDTTSDRVETNVTTLLRDAKHLISDEMHWCRGVLRMRGCHIERYCILGATRAAREASDGLSLTHEWDANSTIYRICQARGYKSTTHMNDDEYTTHTTVMDILDEAIWASMEVM